MTSSRAGGVKFRKKGRGKVAAEVGVWVSVWQSFEGLDVLGFQHRLARTCVLAIRPDVFFVWPYSKRAWQNGRQTSGPYGKKSSKFVVGKRKSVDVWRTSRSPKKSLGAKPVLKRGMAKWPPKCRVVWVSGKVLRA